MTFLACSGTSDENMRLNICGADLALNGTLMTLISLEIYLGNNAG